METARHDLASAVELLQLDDGGFRTKFRGTQCSAPSGGEFCGIYCVALEIKETQRATRCEKQRKIPNR